MIHIGGTAAGLPDDRFTLTLTAPENQELARTSVTVNDGQWQLDLLHGYADVPSEVVIGAYPDDPAITDPYDLAIVVIGGLQYRPEGRYGHFTLDRTDMGGDLMPVSGFASGLGEDPLTLRLLSGSGRSHQRGQCGPGGPFRPQRSRLDC